MQTPWLGPSSSLYGARALCRIKKRKFNKYSRSKILVQLQFPVLQCLMLCSTMLPCYCTNPRTLDKPYECAFIKMNPTQCLINSPLSLPQNARKWRTAQCSDLHFPTNYVDQEQTARCKRTHTRCKCPHDHFQYWPSRSDN